MDSGRPARSYVSSLAAFWPGMQALCGGLLLKGTTTPHPSLRTLPCGQMLSEVIACFVLVVLQSIALTAGARCALTKRRLQANLFCVRHVLLSGLEQDAVELHASFLRAWEQFGWLPEVFNLDLLNVDPHDPG